MGTIEEHAEEVYSLKKGLLEQEANNGKIVAILPGTKGYKISDTVESAYAEVLKDHPQCIDDQLCFLEIGTKKRVRLDDKLKLESEDYKGVRNFLTEIRKKIDALAEEKSKWGSYPEFTRQVAKTKYVLEQMAKMYSGNPEEELDGEVDASIKNISEEGKNKAEPLVKRLVRLLEPIGSIVVKERGLDFGDTVIGRIGKTSEEYGVDVKQCPSIDDKQARMLQASGACIIRGVFNEEDIENFRKQGHEYIHFLTGYIVTKLWNKEIGEKEEKRREPRKKRWDDGKGLTRKPGRIRRS